MHPTVLSCSPLKEKDEALREESKGYSTFLQNISWLHTSSPACTYFCISLPTYFLVATISLF